MGARGSAAALAAEPMTPPVEKIGATYLKKVYCFDEILAAARRELAKVDYDTMVGTGLSGALVVPKLAEALGKQWLMVRKPNDGAHSPCKAEGHMGRKWVFVDDLISSGDTYRHVMETLSDEFYKHRRFVNSSFLDPEHVGAWLYEEKCFARGKSGYWTAMDFAPAEWLHENYLP